MFLLDNLYNSLILLDSMHLEGMGLGLNYQRGSSYQQYMDL